MAIVYDTIREILEEDRLFAVITVVAGVSMSKKMVLLADGSTTGDLGSSEINQQAAEAAKEFFTIQGSGRATVTTDAGESELFIDVFPPKPKLVIIGAVHIAVPLIKYANILEFRTIVIDPRSAFATRERFPHADELIVRWPSDALEALTLDESTYVVTLTHDDKLDNPALQVALKNPVRYIGALGSRKTHAGRLSMLKAAGLTEKELERIHSPVGLNIGALGPQEIALSIMTEIIAVRHGARDSV